MLQLKTEKNFEEKKMKNIKNTLAATVLAAVLGVTSVSANTGLLLSDRGVGGENNVPTCGSSDSGVLSALTGIIIWGATSSATGIIIWGRDGILLGDRNTNGCSTQNKNGLLLSD